MHSDPKLFFQIAFEVLEGLLGEDDEVVGVWYLMGWLHYLTKDADSARFYLEQTQSVSQSTEQFKSSLARQPLLQKFFHRRGWRVRVLEQIKTV